MKKVLTTVIVSGLSWVAVMPAQEAPGVREAVRFQRAEEAAAARQARIEEQSPARAASTEAKPANSEADVEKAVAFERAKDAADARQERIESQRTGAQDKVTSHR